MSLRWPVPSPLVLASLSLTIFACGDGAEFSPAAAPDAVREPHSARIPVITAVSPPLVSSLGGITVNITGRSFQPGAQVFIGGLPVASYYGSSSTQATVTTAFQALPAGPVEVKVVNPDGRQGARSDVLTLFNDNLNLVALRATQATNGATIVGTPDLNGDGHADLVLTDSYQLRTLVWQSRGSYTLGQNIVSPIGTLLFTEIGDFNGDGKTDLIASAGYGTPSALIYLGRGDGTFGMPVSSTLSGLYSVSSAFVGDVNGDGRTDLLVTDSGSVGGPSVDVFLAGTDGRFGSPVVSVVGQWLGMPQLRDCNGDGKADILALSGSRSEVLWLAGSNDGKFAFPVASAVDVVPTRLSVGDYNADGKLDVATLGSLGKLSVRTGRGDGSFTGTTLLGVDPGMQTLASGDVTADGKADLLVGSSYDAGYSTGSAWILSGNGDGTFQTPRNLKVTPLQGATELRVVDVDKDGKLDVVVSSFNDSAVSVLYGHGGGTFTEDMQLAAQATAVASADLNGDGKADVVAVSVSTNKLSVMLGNGDGTTAAPRLYDTDRGPSAVAIADITGDGKADIVVSNYDAATVSLLPGNGDGTFQPQRTFSVGAGANALVVIDMNGDAKLDVVTANYEASSVSVLLNNGAANFNTAKSYATGAGPAALAAGDFNGDGKTDVVTANADANTVSFLQGSAASAGALNAAKSLATGKGPSALIAQDINGDGKLDVITGNTDSGDISVLTGKGDGTFAAASVLAQVGPVTELLFKDLSGDGRPELVAAVGAPRQVFVLYNFAGGVFSPSARTIPVSGPLAAPDLNGDGKADLLVGAPGGAVLLYVNATK